jgi:hypothetical protein
VRSCHHRGSEQEQDPESAEGFRRR